MIIVEFNASLIMSYVYYVCNTCIYAFKTFSLSLILMIEKKNIIKMTRQILTSHEFTNSIEIPINSLWFRWIIMKGNGWKIISNRQNIIPLSSQVMLIEEWVFVCECVRMCLFICFYSFINFNPTGASAVNTSWKKRLNNTKLMCKSLSNEWKT